MSRDVVEWSRASALWFRVAGGKSNALEFSELSPSWNVARIAIKLTWARSRKVCIQGARRELVGHGNIFRWPDRTGKVTCVPW